MLEIFKREDDCLSLIRIVIFMFALSFLLMSIFLCITGKVFAHYESLGIFVMLLIMCGIYNKRVECKYLTIKEANNNE